MINERSSTTVSADVLLPDTQTRICSFANSNELFGALLLTQTKAVTWPLLNLCSSNDVRSDSPAHQHPCDTPALVPNSPAKFWVLISSMWLWGIFCKSRSFSPFFSVNWSALIDFCYEGCIFSGSEVYTESCAVASTGSKHSIARLSVVLLCTTLRARQYRLNVYGICFPIFMVGQYALVHHWANIHIFRAHSYLTVLSQIDLLVAGKSEWAGQSKLCVPVRCTCRFLRRSVHV